MEKTAEAANNGRKQTALYKASGFWIRVGGAAIDFLLIMFASLILFWIITSLFDINFPANRKTGIALWFDLDYWLDIFLASDPALLTWLTIFLATMTIYFLSFQLLWSRTPGMQVTKSKIIDEYGESLSINKAARRTAGYWLNFATLGLGFLWVGFDIEHRGLHDWVARTYVVQE